MIADSNYTEVACSLFVRNMLAHPLKISSGKLSSSTLLAIPFILRFDSESVAVSETNTIQARSNVTQTSYNTAAAGSHVDVFESFSASLMIPVVQML